MKTLGLILFHDFETLDVAGPLEMFGCLPDEIKIILIAEKKAPIQSFQGQFLLAETDFGHAPPLDIILVPGGMGTRTEVNNQNLLSFIRDRSQQAELILSVCTGAALLAKAGILDNKRATSNKRALDWVISQGPKTLWEKKARWVEDGNIITSSGVAAGIDMSLFVIAKLYGEKTRDAVSNLTEYVPNVNPVEDVFSVKS